jgi:hypothetical protein
MRKRFTQFFMLVGLTVGLTVFAQAQTGEAYKVNIPFNFIVGEKSFNAGEYSLKFGVLGDGSKFIIRSADGKQSAIVTSSVPKYRFEILEKGSLTFDVANGHYFLAEVNTRQLGLALNNSRSRAKRKETKPVKRVEVALHR